MIRFKALRNRSGWSMERGERIEGGERESGETRCEGRRVMRERAAEVRGEKPQDSLRRRKEGTATGPGLEGG